MRFAWQFKEPEADLFDVAGGKIGTHCAGPSWEALAAKGCAFGSAGRDVRVPYSADYWFYVDKR